MRILKSLFLAAVAVVAVSGLSTRALAAPVTYTTFYFTGVCTYCAGAGDATGVLVLENYTFGDAIKSDGGDTDQFVSFTYNGTTPGSVFTFEGFVTVDGEIGSAAGMYSVNLINHGPDNNFGTGGSGFWCIGSDGCTGSGPDYGFTHVWSTVPPVASTPEPSSLMLLGTGFAGLASLRRRIVRA